MKPESSTSLLAAVLASMTIGAAAFAQQATSAQPSPSPARMQAPPEMTAANATGPAAEVVALERKIEEAVVAGDVAFFDAASSSDFSFVHGDGWTTGGKPLMEDDRAAFLKRVADKEYLVHDLDQVKVEMHGDVAITYGRYVSLFIPRNRNNATPARLTSIWFERVYAKRDGRWKFLSHRTVHGPTTAPAGVDPSAAGQAATGSAPPAGQRGAGASGQTGSAARRAPAVATRPSAPPSPAAAEVLELDQKVGTAVVNGDVAYVGSVLPDDFVMVHGDGWANGGKPLLVDTKESFLKRVAAKSYKTIDFDSVKAEMHGDVAITYGRYLANTPGGAPERSWFSVWYERVYQKRDGRWIYLSHRTVHGPTYGPDRQAVSDK